MVSATDKKGCLNGLRVIDFGQYVAGPCAAMVLGDYGADVIHIDPPNGPVWKNEEANAVLMRGKKNISLNLKNPQDKETALKLIDSADIVIENFRPGVMDRLGLGWDVCHERNPQLIYCSLPGYSKEDNERKDKQGWEGVVSADGGIYSGREYLTGYEFFQFNALPLASLFASVIACHCIAAALIVREKSGVGQYIESSLYDACFEIDSTRGVDKDVPMVPGGLHIPLKNVNATMICRMMTDYPCKDGRYIQITPPPRGNIKLCEAVFPPEWLTDGIPENADEIVREVMKTRTMREWETFGQEVCGAGVASSLTSEEWLHETHAQDSRTVVKVNDPILGATLQPGVPSLMLRSGECAGTDSRHLPDADREEILEELKTIEKCDKKFGSAEPDLPLKGVKVLDFSQVVAGPTCGRVLAEYGAEVLKINNPRLLDNFTALAGYETQFNGKKTVLLDLKDKCDREIMETLIRESDVFHCNFSQSAYHNLHYSEEELRERNPRIILSQVNIHSLGGGREWMRGHEDLGEAVTGMAVRYGGTLKPKTLPLLVLDHMTGHMSVVGVMLAVYHRIRTGEAQRVQACLSRSSTFAQIPFMIGYEGKKWDEPAGVDVMGYGVCDRMYDTKDNLLYVCAKLSQLKQISELAEAFESDDLEKALESCFKTKYRSKWIEILQEAGISCAPCRKFKQDMCGDGYVFSRGIAKVEDHPGLGILRTIHCPPRLSLTPPKPCYPSSSPGADTEQFKKEFYEKHPQISG